MSRIVSYSELDCFRQCPHKHELAYKERWQAPSLSPALSKGILWHAVMEEHYNYLKLCQDHDRPAVAAELEQLINPYLYDTAGRSSETQELIAWMYQGYVEHYGFDRQWRILAVEHNAVMALPTLKGTASQTKIKVKIDLIVKDEHGRIWVVDHKSGANLPKDKELDIDDQFGLYSWAMRKLGNKVVGSMHSAARTHRNKDQTKHPQPLEERFSRKRLVRSDAELDTIAREAYLAARRAYAIKPGEADRAPNTDTCRWKCDYTEACLAGRKGMDERGLLQDMGFVQDFTRH